MRNERKSHEWFFRVNPFVSIRRIRWAQVRSHFFVSAAFDSSPFSFPGVAKIGHPL
jgi:hypothetical protein